MTSILRTILLMSLMGPGAHAATLNGPLPTPLFPADNWWHLDVTTAPVDPGSAAFIAFVGAARAMHPNLGGNVWRGSAQSYGYPYAVVDGSQPKVAVRFDYSTQSDGVDHATNESLPFYPIPSEAITEPHWIEGGEPGSYDARRRHDRHLLIVDRDNRDLYELLDVWYDGVGWRAGSGAFFDLDANDRRPDGWTSADAAGLAVLPGLIRFDEVFGTDDIRHAFRVTMRATNSDYVFPASHRQDDDAAALPMGARLRLKASVDISCFEPECQKIFRAMKTYGLIVADNGADMSVGGTYDVRWDSGVLNPCFDAMTAGDFDVIQLGWNPRP